MRYQVTWTSPIVAHEGESENIGVYGVEGSKPGAAAVGTYLSHEVIGLNYKGYGALLGEATFSCTRVTNFSLKWIFVSDANVLPINSCIATGQP